MPRRYVPSLVLPIFVAGLIGCGSQAPVETVRVDNPTLGIAIASLPEAFEVVSAKGETIELTAPGLNGPGTLVITAGPLTSSNINLIEITKERMAWFESTPGAQWFGKRELGTPYGTAITARGTYPTETGEVEETWVYAIHPGEYRLLSITFTYPTGESEERVGQLMELLGEIESTGAEIVPAEGE